MSRSRALLMGVVAQQARPVLWREKENWNVGDDVWTPNLGSYAVGELSTKLKWGLKWLSLI